MNDLMWLKRGVTFVFLAQLVSFNFWIWFKDDCLYRVRGMRSGEAVAEKVKEEK